MKKRFNFLLNNMKTGDNVFVILTEKSIKYYIDSLQEILEKTRRPFESYSCSQIDAIYRKIVPIESKARFLKKEMPIIKGEIRSIKEIDGEKIYNIFHGDFSHDDYCVRGCKNLTQNKSFRADFQEKYIFQEKKDAVEFLIKEKNLKNLI